MHVESIEELLGLIDEGCSDLDAHFETTVRAVNEFQQDPSVLDLRLPKYILNLTAGFFDSENLGTAKQLRQGEMFYHFAKVCTLKKVSKHLSTDIYLLPRLIEALHLKLQQESQWYSSFLLLAWLHILVIAPFQLANDEQIFHEIAKYKQNQSLYSLVCNIQAQLLIKNSKLLVENAVVLLELRALNSFLKVLVKKPKDQYNLIDEQLLHTVSRECLQDKSHEHSETQGILLVKILPKLFKLHYFYEDWDSMEDIISWLLSHLDSQFTEFRFAVAHSYSKIVEYIIKEIGDPEMMRDLIQSRVEEAVVLLRESTWDIIDIDILHSYLLIIAELAKHIVKYIPELCEDISSDILAHTSKFQQKRLNQIKGSQIRDASNFICWSFARCKSIPPKIITDIFLSLLVSSLFDRDLIIRKSANAALQEVLGRHGSFIMDNVTVLRIIELPVSDIRYSYLRGTTLLYQIFNDNYPQFWKHITHWMFEYNIKYNNDLYMVRLNVSAIKILLETIDVSESSITENQINDLLFNDAINVPPERIVYSLSVLKDFVDWEKIKTPLDKIFNSLLDTKLHKNSNTDSESFKFLSILIFWSLSLNKNDSEFFKFEVRDTDLLLHILRNLNEQSGIFDEIKIHTNKIVSKLSNSPDFFFDEATRNNFWMQYEKFLRFSNSLTCYALPGFASGTFLDLFYRTLPMLTSRGKSKILIALTPHISRIYKELGISLLSTMLALLDDYTITEQGDVGRLVRTSSARLIKSNIELFFSTDQMLTTKLIEAFMRLSGEPQMELRELSFEILCIHFKYNPDKNMTFDERVLIFQHNIFEGESRDFWKGFLMTAGAIHSTDIQIKSAVDGFLKYYNSLRKESFKLELCNNLIRIIPSSKDILESKNKSSADDITGSKNQDILKITVSYLQFWKRIFESGIQMNSNFNFKGVYAKLYNLQLLKGSNLLRNSALKLFAHLPILQYHSLSSIDRGFSNIIIKRLIRLAIKGDTENTTSSNSLYRISIEGLVQLFIAFEDHDKLKKLKAISNETKLQNLLDESEFII